MISPDPPSGNTAVDGVGGYITVYDGARGDYRTFPYGHTGEYYAPGTYPRVITDDHPLGNRGYVPATEMVGGMLGGDDLNPRADHHIVPELHGSGIEDYAVRVDPQTSSENDVRTDVAMERRIDANLGRIPAEELVEYRPPLGCGRCGSLQKITFARD